MYRDGSCWLPHVAAPFFDFYGRISVFSGLGLEMTDFECGKVRQSPRMVHGVVLWDTQGLPHVAALFSNFYGRNFNNFRLFLVLRVKSRFLGLAKCGNHLEWSMGCSHGIPKVCRMLPHFFPTFMGKILTILGFSWCWRLKWLKIRFLYAACNSHSVRMVHWVLSNIP